MFVAGSYRTEVLATTVSVPKPFLAKRAQEGFVPAVAGSRKYIGRLKALGFFLRWEGIRTPGVGFRSSLGTYSGATMGTVAPGRIVTASASAGATPTLNVISSLAQK